LHIHVATMRKFTHVCAVVTGRYCSWWRLYCHFKASQNDKILVINNNNNCSPSLCSCFQGDRKQGILLCWPYIHHISNNKFPLSISS